MLVEEKMNEKSKKSQNKKEIVIYNADTNINTYLRLMLFFKRKRVWNIVL